MRINATSEACGRAKCPLYEIRENIEGLVRVFVSTDVCGQELEASYGNGRRPCTPNLTAAGLSEPLLKVLSENRSIRPKTAVFRHRSLNRHKLKAPRTLRMIGEL